jgi:hypothetical protein
VRSQAGVACCQSGEAKVGPVGSRLWSSRRVNSKEQSKVKPLLRREMPFNITADYLAAVTLKVFFGVLTVALALTGYGCGDDGSPSPPVSPSPTVVDVPPPPGRGPDPNLPGELWRFTTTVTSLEGSACFWNLPVGARIDNWAFSVERVGEQVRFRYGNVHDHILFVGDVKEQSFTAVSDTYHSYWQCSGGVTFSSSVVGSFSSDGRALSGRERLIYRVQGGSELIITLEWNATSM